MYSVGDKFGVSEANAMRGLWAAGTAPGSPDEGDAWLDTSVSPAILKKYNGTGWDLIGSFPLCISFQDNIDQNNDIIHFIKVPQYYSSIKIKLVGLNFPSYLYTELGEHSHAKGTLQASGGTAASSTHKHSGGDLYTGTSGAHNHGGSTGQAGADAASGPTHAHSISSDGGHAHNTIVGQTSTPTATVEITGNITGNTAAKGVNGGTLSTSQKTTFSGSLLQVYISTNPSSWGTALSQDFSGLYNNGGTSEIDITSDVSAGTYNFIRLHLNTSSEVGGKVIGMIKIS